MISIDDLATQEIEEILARARSSSPPTSQFSGRTVGLLFLSSSTRTRVGFAVAAARLGCIPIDVTERRFGGPMGKPESLADTLRTLSGMVDVVIARIDERFTPDLVEVVRVPLVNAGDVDGEHPTQALVDLFAIEQLRGPLSEVTFGLCGDLSMRGARSLLRLMHRIAPKQLVIMAPESRLPASEVLEKIRCPVEVRPVLDSRGLDVLYMVGLPPGHGRGRLSDELRERYRLSGRTLSSLPVDAVVLAPLPVIDEMTSEARHDERVRMFDQSDLGIRVRTALLEYLFATAGCVNAP